jgi:hypothetical protein
MLLIDDEDRVPEAPTKAENLLTDSLGPKVLLAIDEAIMNATRPRWMKVARVVADAIHAGGYKTDDEQVQLHVRRIVALVVAGRIEAQGNLLRPRFSEIRLPAGEQ